MEQLTPWSVGSQRQRRWVGSHRLTYREVTVTLGRLPDGRWYVDSAYDDAHRWETFDREVDAAAVAGRLAVGLTEEPVFRPAYLSRAA